LIVLKYERRFQDLAAFASTYFPTKHYRVERFCDGLRQELKMILIAMQFQSVRELLRVAQGIDRVIRDASKPVVEQSQATGAKRRDFRFLTGRPPLLKKGKVGSHQDSSRGEVRVSPQEVAHEDLDKFVQKDPGEDRLNRESRMLECLQSRRDQCIHSVKGVSIDILEIMS
jgi:hypothetical protein